MIKRSIKMVVTPEESQQVQEICFADGIGWFSSGGIIQLTNKKYLIIDEYITYCSKMYFEEKNLEEVDATFFIKTNGLCIEENQEQELNKNINKEETMEKNEVKSYADVREYLVAKGLYDRVMEIEWDDEVEEYEYFSDLYLWANTEEGVFYWDEIDEDLKDLGINMNIESLVQDYKAKQGKEFIQYLEVQPEEVVETKPTSYTNAKEYLIAKGLYEDVLTFNLDFEGYSKYFGNMFWFNKTPQGFDFWRQIELELTNLEINNKLDEILRDYEIRKLEVTAPTQKPKQYLCYVQGKALPKHIHKTLEQAKQEAQRLCRKELVKVSVLEVVAEYEAEVLVKEVL